MLTQNEKQKSQNYNQKPKMNLKQRAYLYSIKLIKFIDQLPKDSSSQIIAKQLLRSGTSIGANIVEAHGSSGRKDFANFFTHALKSSNESKYWLGLLRDTQKAPKEKTEILLDETIQLANILASSLLTIRGKKTF
ncbi:MAG: four helix bundle protein [Candidatus Nealsonbacteria bacterium]|nr:four helix bundle protein [Candidatus Nealsonbacteria bacterium]